MRLSTFKGGLVPLVALLALGAGLAGCSGDDGKNGAAGPAGPGGTPGATGPVGPTGAPGATGAGVDLIASAKPESCLTCHSSAGVDHQNIYRDYQDAKTKSKFKLALTSLAAVANPAPATTYTVTLNFHVDKVDANGINFIPYDEAGLTSLDQKRFAVQGYYAGAVNEFTTAKTISLGSITSVGAGNYTTKSTTATFDPTLEPGWQAYGYIADAPIDVEGISLYADVADAGLAGGTAAAGSPTKYKSTVEVSTCEQCHGAPYLKHGYRAAVVAGLPDFAACKECHYDDRVGSDQGFQWMADQPLEWATANTSTIPADIKARYPYSASVMQDTHQSHAMEFAYPQSMSNCITCHKTQANMDRILVDANFKVETCKSCHVVDGKDAWATQKYNEAGRAPALKEMWTNANVLSFHDVALPCGDCHKAAGVGKQFKTYHTGYNAKIYDATNTRYSTIPANQVAITSITQTGDVLDVKFTAGNTAIVPTLTLSFYGYDAKNMLVSSHTRDNGAKDCAGTTCRYEFTIDANPVSAANTNRLFALQADSVPGAWHVQMDLTKYVQPVNTGLDTIPALITAGKVKKAEIVVIPSLKNANGDDVALNAPSKTFDLVGKAVVANYFQGTNAVVSVAKCNACHDSLGTTFHSAGYGGNVTLCRTCHVTTSGGAHLEMQSRGIDSYVHAIHKFQKMDTTGVDFTDKVFAKRYQEHVESGFPNFTIKNCEACHVTSGGSVPVTYNPADNTKSLPGLESAAYTLTKGWVDLATGAPVAGPRNIGKVPALVTGPASRACGGCHKAVLINEDDEARLASFNSHVDMGGYNVENDAANTYVYKMIDRIMTYFK